jgi:hypothetical protein
MLQNKQAIKKFFFIAGSLSKDQYLLLLRYLFNRLPVDATLRFYPYSKEWFALENQSIRLLFYSIIAFLSFYFYKYF